MRITFFICLFLLRISLEGQIPVYDYLKFEKSLIVPESINRERTAVVVQVPDRTGSFREVGDWKQIAEKVHKAFVKMGIDAVFYLNHYALGSDISKKNHKELFDSRRVEHIIFITKSDAGFELIICHYSRTSSFLSLEKPVFYLQKQELYELLLQTGKEIRRADLSKENFLIPEKPNYIKGISIVEKSLLKNYPGILRRSKLVVERFSKLSVPSDSDDEINQKIDSYNKDIENKNAMFVKLMEAYPYDYEFIDPMNDEDLLRRRHQFVLRSVSGPTDILRQMLNFDTPDSETDYVSTIPIMPDQTQAKPIPRDALVHKFYIRQNISKNIHAGVWDADVTWEDALGNMIGNLIQEHNADK
ncbi:MAG: hypothetical protein GDA42_01975 [Ekhidna sp.]|nr:hypothetical protein [Ekhidna sp.]